MAIASGPNTFDPRVGLDDASQKISQLIFDSLFDLDDNMRVTPKLAERLERPTPTTYVVTLRRGVRFHGRRLELFHEAQRLIAADIPYISLRNKTNFVIAQPSLDGVRVSTLADLTFLQHVARIH